jgi:hypothetical protein
MIAVVHGVIERVQEVREVKRTSVLNFTLKATVRMGDKEYPRYVRCAAWGKLGESIQADVRRGPVRHRHRRAGVQCVHEQGRRGEGVARSERA